MECNKTMQSLYAWMVYSISHLSVRRQKYSCVFLKKKRHNLPGWKFSTSEWPLCPVKRARFNLVPTALQVLLPMEILSWWETLVFVSWGCRGTPARLLAPCNSWGHVVTLHIRGRWRTGAPMAPAGTVLPGIKLQARQTPGRTRRRLSSGLTQPGARRCFTREEALQPSSAQIYKTPTGHNISSI